VRDAFRTIAGPASARLTRNRSRFLSFARCVRSEDEAAKAIAEFRKTYHDASHVCSAYRLFGDQAGISGSDDDGEPSGSAGEPILRRIEGAELENVLVAVVRYYGGVNLGVGGLIRAYGDAAEEALDAAKQVSKAIQTSICIEFPPDVTSGVMGTIHRLAAVVKRIEYDAAGLAEVSLPPSRIEAFLAALREATGARARTSTCDGKAEEATEVEVRE